MGGGMRGVGVLVPSPMSQKKSPSLHTYLLENVMELDRKKLSHGAVRFTVKRDRAVLVSFKAPDKRFIARDMDGDQSAMVAAWLRQNTLEGLHEEYLKRCPVPYHEQKSAALGWKKAQLRRAKLDEDYKRETKGWLARQHWFKEEMAKAKKEEHEKSAEIVRTHGNAPFVVGGFTWDPCYAGETVFLVPRRGVEPQALP